MLFTPDWPSLPSDLLKVHRCEGQPTAHSDGFPSFEDENRTGSGNGSFVYSIGRSGSIQRNLDGRGFPRLSVGWRRRRLRSLPCERGVGNRHALPLAPTCCSTVRVLKADGMPGNSVVFGVELDPHPDFTAMALLALAWLSSRRRRRSSIGPWTTSSLG